MSRSCEHRKAFFFFLITPAMLTIAQPGDVAESMQGGFKRSFSNISITEEPNQGLAQFS